MSSSDFRHITIKSDAKKAERLFRAAVTAFCSLTRPSRREIVQLEDLALPLFDEVSVEAKRYVAAALSECAWPPPALVLRLADESIDIAAPLLMRSRALTDIDLIALIARHGYGHARAIGRRPGLNPAIARLVAVLERKVAPLRQSDTGAADRSHAAANVHLETAAGSAADDARTRLRAMMRPAAATPSATRERTRTSYDRLRETVLSGHAAFFQTALADALAKDFAAIREISADPSYAWLLDALRVLDVSDEKAFLVTAAYYPAHFGDLQSIRLFLLRYASLGREDALQRIGRWQPSAQSARLAPADDGGNAASGRRAAG
ncbi:hypothetical protein [Mesorhizobium marinum]|uniref:DUF2336 domain-containing protein n=1 Tax=Mesorhizobium marinum TaxID=3228790 RepID=A0ABV3R0T7_9HYPH